MAERSHYPTDNEPARTRATAMEMLVLNPEMWMFVLKLFAVAVACVAAGKLFGAVWCLFESFTEEPDQDARDELAYDDHKRWQLARQQCARESDPQDAPTVMARPANDNGRRVRGAA